MPATLASLPVNGAADKQGGIAWSAEGMTQDDLMLKDECIVVNYLDEITGHDNKYNCHKFIPGQPKGILHRAFSVMLFDHEGRILVQQRAASKITFPNFWANTCCSHPLHGMQPKEVDQPEDVASGKPMGVKHAAVRKLNHELGIPQHELQPARFKFMTRVHYWAADSLTYGNDAPWGENEIDYLLLYKLGRGETLTIEPNPEEVQAIRWLSRDELHASMATEAWSPWFKLIATHLMDPWWADLDHAVSTNKYVDLHSIHRFDPPAEFQGGAGNARPNLEEVSRKEHELAPEAKKSFLSWGAKEVDPETLKTRRRVVQKLERHDMILGLMRKTQDAASATMKQGAYGKVKTHSHSKKDQLSRPVEVVSALHYVLFKGSFSNNIAEKSDDVEFCVKMLNAVSRSFAAVITQLPKDVCIDIMIFYLVLRALDTIEDDMEAYVGREHEKKEALIQFGEKRLSDTAFSLDGVGEGDERLLLQRFGTVAKVFNALPKLSQDVIRDITNKMGAGMAACVDAELAQGTADQAAYDRYCHSVAGLVGEGLTRIFVARGIETDVLSAQGERIWPFCADPKKEKNNMGLANSMGLFLQKANIIRDYLEDYVDGRAFWPQSVWQRHSKTTDLGEFARPSAHGAGVRVKVEGKAGAVAGKGVGTQALVCLNDLVADACELVPDCLEYLARVRDPAVFRFCAIPQVMAIATLAECFDNPKVFTGVVKIRKGMTVRLMNACCSGHANDAVHWWFAKFAIDMERSVDTGKCVGAGGPVGDRIKAACQRIRAVTKPGYEAEEARTRRTWLLAAAVGAAATAFAVRRRGL